MRRKKHTLKESNAFIEMIHLSQKSSGPLAGLSFSVQDLIDVAGYITGAGSPSWKETHPRAEVNAVCVDMLLHAGAKCVGKTVLDELGLGLLGENPFYATPLNPQAPSRLPGGACSGGASAVACGLVDFSIGVDPVGSILTPASYCGLYGFRPSHGMISMAGALSFSPTFDTIGVMASSSKTLIKAACTLLGRPVFKGSLRNIYIIEDLISLLEPDVHRVFDKQMQWIKDKFPGKIFKTTLSQITALNKVDIAKWLESFCSLLWGENWSCLGSWIKQGRPKLGERANMIMQFAQKVPRQDLLKAQSMREFYCDCLKNLLEPHDVICMPTTPIMAPLKKSDLSESTISNYYQKSWTFHSIASVGRLPQITIPYGRVEDVPLGLSFLGAYSQDTFLLHFMEEIGNPEKISSLNSVIESL